MITKEYLQKLARSLMFEISDEESMELVQEFDLLLQQIQILDQIDTSGVEEMVYPITSYSSYLREDLATDSLTTQEVLLNASHQDGEYIEVVKVLK